MEWHQLSVEETVSRLETDLRDGLSSGDAAARLATNGPNVLVDRGLKSPWSILLAQFREVMVLILIVAALISAGLGEVVDAIVILIIVVMNAILGFTQEFRAERAMAALKDMAVPTVRVRRNGHVQEISSSDLTPGDLVLLETGNLVPADGRIVQSVNLRLDEAALTGESEPSAKAVEALDGDNLQVGDRKNMVYMGTVVAYGRGEVLLTATAMATELGKIADLLQTVENEQTPLQRRLAQLGTILAWGALAIIVVVLVLGLLQGQDLETLFLTGISMAVAAVPESLAAVVTITLALGSQRLLARRALMRRLPAVETLGSVTPISSDKTGTLTENRMTVTLLDIAGNAQDLPTLSDNKGVLLPARLANDAPSDFAALSVLIRAGALNNDAVLEEGEDGALRAIGDPTEGALAFAAYQVGWDLAELRRDWPRVAEVPFTSERKRMTTVHRMSPELMAIDHEWANAPSILFTKGAVDSLLEICSEVLIDKHSVPLTEEYRARIIHANDQYAAAGQRVLGVSLRLWKNDELPEDAEAYEGDEVFVGLIAMMDPPRPEVEEAVLTARRAGIRPVMITGDHPLTAMRIARDLHITDSDDEKFLRGQDLATMSPSELRDVVGDVAVYARVAPEHKLKIVQALQEQGEIVAMTGDGVNDAPALKQADMGVAMGIMGTDVSKEAADMVLLDDNFATIVAAVEEGRIIFDNIRKFIKYTLSSNIGELFLMLVGPLFGMPLPLLPLQILWVNLVTDGLPGLALAVEPGERGIMERGPYKPTESVFSRGIGRDILWVGALMGIVSLALGYVYWLADPEGPWRTIVFTTLTLSQMGNALATRSSLDPIWRIGLLSNRLMVLAVALTFALQMALLYVPFLQGIFSTVALTLWDLGVSLVVSLIVMAAVEAVKIVREKS